MHALFEEEIGAIEAIYPELISQVADQIYKFKVPQHENIEFQMIFPDHYPNVKPTIFNVQSPASAEENKYLKDLFAEVLDSIYHKGDVAIFDLFTELEQVLHDSEFDEIEIAEDHWTSEDAKEVSYVYDEQAEKEKSSKKGSSSKTSTVEEDPFLGWTISEPIVDRKSTFVAFAKRVDTVEDVRRAFEQLTKDKKIQRSSHNMRAYRIKKGDIVYQDCDDDGETAAGGRMLHLLNVMDVSNVFVVCSRWFGGSHIGPSRFKHINSATRDAVVKLTG